MMRSPISPLWFAVPVDEISGREPEDRLWRPRQLFIGGGNFSFSVLRIFSESHVERLEIFSCDFPFSKTGNELV